MSGGVYSVDPAGQLGERRAPSPQYCPDLGPHQAWVLSHRPETVTRKQRDASPRRRGMVEVPGVDGVFQ